MTRRDNVEYGDREVALPNEILRSVVGSGVHGIAIEGTDDHDEMGVYIEPPEYLLGVERHRDDYIWRTQPEGVRSGPGDTDLVMYSLQKYLRLAIKGNPTVMLPLFAPEQSLVVLTPLGEELRALRTSFLSRLAVERFLGYMRSQHERMLGQSKRNVPNRSPSTAGTSSTAATPYDWPIRAMRSPAPAPSRCRCRPANVSRCWP